MLMALGARAKMASRVATAGVVAGLATHPLPSNASATDGLPQPPLLQLWGLHGHPPLRGHQLPGRCNELRDLGAWRVLWVCVLG